MTGVDPGEAEDSREGTGLAPALGVPADPGLAPALAGPWRLAAGEPLAAVLAAAPAGAAIALPAGTWRLPDALRIDRPLTITGAGTGQTRLVGGGGALLEIALPGEGRVTLADLTLVVAAPEEGAWLAAEGLRVLAGTATLRRVHVGGPARAGAVRVEGATARLEAEGCELSGSGGCGLRVLDGATARLVDVVLVGHAGFGLLAAGDAAVEATGLVARGNGRGGVAIDGARATLADGHLVANGRRGVVVWAHGACRLHGHTVEGNFGPGIEIVSGAGVALAGNRCVGTRGPGILIGERVRLTAEANACEGNEGDGVTVLRGACARLAGNQAHGNGRYGVWIAAGADASLVENAAAGNRHGDVVASWGAVIAAPEAGLAAVRRRTEPARPGGLPAPRGRHWR